MSKFAVHLIRVKPEHKCLNKRSVITIPQEVNPFCGPVALLVAKDRLTKSNFRANNIKRNRSVRKFVRKARGLWRYISAKVQTLVLVCNIAALNCCSFSHSNIQLLQFNIAHSQFNVHISNATLLEHATFLFNVRCVYTV